jgi:hypothetical protein
MNACSKARMLLGVVCHHHKALNIGARVVQSAPLLACRTSRCTRRGKSTKAVQSIRQPGQSRVSHPPCNAVQARPVDIRGWAISSCPLHMRLAAERRLWIQHHDIFEIRFLIPLVNCKSLFPRTGERLCVHTGVRAAKLGNVVEALRSRGLVQDITSEELGELSTQETLTVYVGFDPTADAIHVGNLLALIVLSWFQRCGHQAVALLGGATGRVGDPSGKSAERPVLAPEEIESNVAGIRNIIQGILERNRGDDQPAVKVYMKPHSTSTPPVRWSNSMCRR